MSEIIPIKDNTYKVIIRVGALINHSTLFYYWPDCNKSPHPTENLRPARENNLKYPHQIFDGKFNGIGWDCIRIGYGKLREECLTIPLVVDVFGNGSIHVFETDGVMIVDEKDICPHCGEYTKLPD